MWQNLFHYNPTKKQLYCFCLYCLSIRQSISLSTSCLIFRPNIDSDYLSFHQHVASAPGTIAVINITLYYNDYGPAYTDTVGWLSVATNTMTHRLRTSISLLKLHILPDVSEMRKQSTTVYRGNLDR